MRKRFAVLAFVLALLVAGAFSRASIAAPMNEEVAIGVWNLDTYSDERTGKFENCVMQSVFSHGITVLFSLDRNSRWLLVLENDAWALQRGAEYQVAYGMDGDAPIEATATAFNEHQVVIELDPTHGQFARFRKGHVLTVSAASQKFEFELHDMEKALDATFACAKRHGADLSPSARDPFANMTGVPRPLDLQIEATGLVANLLAQSGIEHFFIAVRSDIPADILPLYDTAWSADDLNGGIKVLFRPEPTDETSSALISRQNRFCKGGFSTGKVPDRNPLVVRFFTVCNASNGATFYYTIVPRRAGGSFVLNVWSESGAVAKAADEKMRAAVAKVMDR